MSVVSTQFYKKIEQYIQDQLNKRLLAAETALYSQLARYSKHVDQTFTPVVITINKQVQSNIETVDPRVRCTAMISKYKRCGRKCTLPSVGPSGADRNLVCKYHTSAKSVKHGYVDELLSRHIPCHPDQYAQIPVTGLKKCGIPPDIERYYRQVKKVIIRGQVYLQECDGESKLYNLDENLMTVGRIITVPPELKFVVFTEFIS